MAIRYPRIPGLGDLLYRYFLSGKEVTDPQLNTSREALLIELKDFGIASFAAAALGMPLESITNQAMQRTPLMLLIADEISKTLSDQGVKNYYIRGAYIATFYPHPQLRSFSDLDLLINPEDLHQTISFLKDRGAYTAKKDQISFQRGYWDGMQFFFNKPQKLLLELHVDFAPLNRFPNPQIIYPPIKVKEELVIQALAVILHSSTHHYQSPLRALLDIMVLSAHGLDWTILGKLIDKRKAWKAALPLIADLDDFAPGIVPLSYVKRSLTINQVQYIRMMADKITQSGGVYRHGNLLRRSVLTTLYLPDIDHALGALLRGLDFHLFYSKIAT